MANTLGSGTPIPTTKVIPAQNVSPVETYSTLTVKLKDYDGDGDGLAVINAHDFDPEKHEKVNDKGKADEKQKAKKFEFKEELVEPTLDDNDLKELGPPKTKAEKDRLENSAKLSLAKGDQGKLREKFVEVVGEDAVSGQQQLPPQMHPTSKVGVGVGVEKSEKEAAKDRADKDTKDLSRVDKAAVIDKGEPPLTPRK